MNRIVVVDPGLNTGVVSFSRGDISGMGTFHFGDWDVLEEFVEGGGLIIVEDFILRPDLAQKQGGTRMWSSEVIGYTRALANKYDMPIHFQAPINQVPDELLKTLGLWNLPKEEGFGTRDLPHIRSALAHLVHYMGKENPEWIRNRLEKMTSGS